MHHYQQPSFITDEQWNALSPYLSVHSAIKLYGSNIRDFYTAKAGEVLGLIMDCLPSFDWTSVNKKFKEQREILEQEGGIRAVTDPKTFLNLLIGKVIKPADLGAQYGINQLIDEVKDPHLAVEIYEACDGAFFDSTHVEISSRKKLAKLVKTIEKKTTNEGLLGILKPYLV